MGVHRTCGGPSEIELTAIGVELNGLRRVTHYRVLEMDVAQG